MLIFNVKEKDAGIERDYELEQKYLHDTIAQQGDKIIQQESMLAQKDDMLCTAGS